MSPKVSICIPVFNGGRFIEQAIESVLGQTYQDLELIVVDNCSTDDTAARVSGFEDRRLSLVRAEEHVDAVANFRRATARCEGQYVKLLCADDTLTATCLETQVAALDQYPTAGLAACRRMIIDQHGRPLIRSRGLGRMEGLVTGPEAIARCVRSGTNLLGEPGAVLMRSSMLKRAGTWSERWPYMVDLDLWFRLLHIGDLVAIRETLATFRVHTGGWSAEIGEYAGVSGEAAVRAGGFSSGQRRYKKGFSRRRYESTPAAAWPARAVSHT